MKIIDDKGRLFGTVNILDLLVVLIIVLAVIGGAKRLKSRPYVQQQSVKAELVLFVDKVRMPSVKAVKIGDPLFFYDKGIKVGTIKDLKVEAHKEPTDMHGKFENVDVPDKYDMYITLECEAKDSENYILIGGEQMRIGYTTQYKNKNIAMTATVYGLELEK